MQNLITGRLFIISTPIGNLDDITRRAVSTLENVDIVACEDTRHTGRLLSRLDIKKPLLSYHNFNESKRSSVITDHLLDGKDVALVSDSGTPGVSDPAYRVVRVAIDADIPIFAVPGPSALLSALVISGLPLDRFVFEGFLPPKGAKRLKRLETLSDETRTIIFFESPHRILYLLENISSILGDRYVSVSREMTKLHEETVRGQVSTVLENLRRSKPRGEYTVVVHGSGKKGTP